MTSDDCRVVLVFCCEGEPVAPAHMHRPTPVCSCGWIGTEHHHKLGAELEWYEDHRYPEDGEEAMRRHAARLTYASFVLSGRETPAGYVRTAQVQALVDKLRALRDARLEVSGYWDNGQEIPDE